MRTDNNLNSVLPIIISALVGIGSLVGVYVTLSQDLAVVKTTLEDRSKYIDRSDEIQIKTTELEIEVRALKDKVKNLEAIRDVDRKVILQMTLSIQKLETIITYMKNDGKTNNE